MNNQKDSFVYLRGMDTVINEDEDTVSIGELPDKSLSGEFEEALRKVSFSSIASFDTRNTYISALDTLRQATFPHLLLTRNLRQSSKFSPSPSSSTMDSPSDLSPNAPPGGNDNYHNDQFSAIPAVRNENLHSDEAGRETTSGNDSEDSSGFEKVDPHSDLLADYSTNFHNQMQQSLYGQLPDDPSARSHGVDLLGDFDDEEEFIRPSQPEDNSFEIVGKDHIELLSPSFGNIDEPPMDSTSHHGVADILEHAYDAAHEKVDDLIGQLAETEGAKAIDKAVHEVPKAVDDFVHQTHDFVDPPKPVHSAMDDLSDLMGDVIEKPSTLIPEPIKEMLVDAPISPSEDSGRDTVSKLLGDNSDEDEPQFGQQTPEEDTFHRDGPLRIPADLIEQAEPEDVPVHAAPSHDHHHGFETVARPPTPPKDISEEDVKPSTVQLGHHESHHDPHRSILKHSGSTSSPTCRGAWCDFKSVDPRVLDLIYWRDPKKSGIALGAILTVLFILTRFPLITVISYTGLAVLTGTLGFRIIKAVEAQIKKTDGSNPFAPYLEQDLSIPQERVREQVDVIVEHAQCLVRQLRRLFLVESIVDSVKFGLLLWSFTYIGAWFSGCTLVFLTVIAIFSVPKIYETYQEPIDAQLAVVKGHIDNVTNILEEKLPFLKRATAEVEKKEQ